MELTRVMLAGFPNVGKSLLFNQLTGKYATVSNYPGTSVEVTRGQSRYAQQVLQIMDCPGFYSLLPFTEEERVTRAMLFSGKPDVVVHVVDAKNLRRMLGLTLQLMAAGLPVLLNLNMMDEAQRLGVAIDIRRLSAMLGIPVVATSAVRKTGLDQLRRELLLYQRRDMPLEHCHQIGGAARKTEVQTAAERQTIVDGIVNATVKIVRPCVKPTFADRAGGWARRPVTGVLLLGFVLYFGLYQLVGRFGAGVLVDYLDTQVFSAYITPAMQAVVQALIPWDWLQSLIMGEFGVFSMGLRYSLAIVLPIVGVFFLVFAVLEDCGYLPRLALLANGLFRHFGLNGRAVIPVALGLGCGTMAVMVTRTLETKRERVLATFLLSLTIPCSSQLGVVLALLSENRTALALWSLAMAAMFILVGWVSARLIPGQSGAFYMELPPLRLPQVSNVLVKVYRRLRAYFLEIIPLFMLVSVGLWSLEQWGVMEDILNALQPVMSFVGLPPAAAQSFLLGFFRRDYGAAGLYDLRHAGLLVDSQLLIAATVLTLFVPCVAQMAVMIKERGVRTAAVMFVLIAGIAIAAGRMMNGLLALFPVI